MQLMKKLVELTFLPQHTYEVTWSAGTWYCKSWQINSGELWPAFPTIMWRFPDWDWSKTGTYEGSPYK